MNGVDLAKRILRAAPSAKVLLMSGYAREEYLTPADDLPFIGKPFTTRAIVDRLRSHPGRASGRHVGEPSGLTWSDTQPLVACDRHGRPAGAQLSQVRPSRVRVGGAGAARSGAAWARPPWAGLEPIARQARLRVGVVGRARLLRRHGVLDQRRAGAVRRPADAGGDVRDAAAGRLPRAVSRRRRGRDCRVPARVRGSRRWRSPRRPGWPPSSCAARSSAAFPGCRSATARWRCCRSRRWRASSASTACRRSSPRSTSRWRRRSCRAGRTPMDTRRRSSGRHRGRGRVGRVAHRAGRSARRRTAAARRPRAGQHRAGRQVGSAPGAPHHHHLHGDDARRGQARRAST